MDKSEATSMILGLLKRLIKIVLWLLAVYFVVGFIGVMSHEPRETPRLGSISPISSIMNEAENVYGQNYSYESVCEDETVVRLIEYSVSHTSEEGKDVTFLPHDDSYSDSGTAVCHDSEEGWAVGVPILDPWKPAYDFWTRFEDESFCVDSTGFRGYVRPGALEPHDVTCE